MGRSAVCVNFGAFPTNGDITLAFALTIVKLRRRHICNGDEWRVIVLVGHRHRDLTLRH